jgi:hypothetical protein
MAVHVRKDDGRVLVVYRKDGKLKPETPAPPADYTLKGDCGGPISCPISIRRVRAGSLPSTHFCASLDKLCETSVVLLQLEAAMFIASMWLVGWVVGFLCGLSYGKWYGRKFTKDGTPSASHNRPMPKLPQFMEMFQMYMVSQSLISGNDSQRVLKGFTEFVERQLSA